MLGARAIGEYPGWVLKCDLTLIQFGYLFLVRWDSIIEKQCWHQDIRQIQAWLRVTAALKTLAERFDGELKDQLLKKGHWPKKWQIAHSIGVTAGYRGSKQSPKTE